MRPSTFRAIGAGFLATWLGSTPALAADGFAALGALEFQDIRYCRHRLSELPPAKATVVVFTSYRCAASRDGLVIARAIEAETKARGAQFIAINAQPGDTVKEMAAQGLEAEIPFPLGRDGVGQWSKTFGVKRAASAVVVDELGRTRYRGGLGAARAMDQGHGAAELKAAIEAVLAGRGPVADGPPSQGLAWEVPESRASADPVTFVEVAPIVHKHCVECHRPGTEAPFSLVTYAQVVAQGENLVEVIADQRMPPWYAGPEHNQFANQRGLSAKERESIIAWVRLGMPAGAESAPPLPPPPETVDNGWIIGTPDLIVTAAQPHTLPADGIVPYQYVILPYVFRQDTWIQATQILPSNPRVVHHCNLGYLRPADVLDFKKLDLSRIGALLGKVPGVCAMDLKDGIALMIPRGAVLGMQIHYTTTGKPEQNVMSVGFRYAREKVRKRGRHLIVTNRRFAIPPGAALYPVTQSAVLPVDAIGIGLFTHMHVRGRDMTFWATYPGVDRAEKLLTIPNYNFDWQQEYLWRYGSKRFPAGTRIECVAHYDNSRLNPYNPDPSAVVRDGPQTHEEMHFGFLFYTDANENLSLDIDPKTGWAMGGRETRSGASGERPRE